MQKFRNFAPMFQNTDVDINSLFASDESNFEGNALSVFNFQYQHNELYRQYCELIRCDPRCVDSITNIPFLPISFFKSREVTTTVFKPKLVFESSKTTGAVASRHSVKEASVYEQSYLQSFELFYGDVKNYCIIGLLPSYLERENSSLVYMVNDLIKRSGHESGGFFLHDFRSLHALLTKNEAAGQATLLFGVTFALLDFACAYPLPLRHTIIIETGGMKGRKREMTREEVHVELGRAFETRNIHSEYGMTELLSQAYATSHGMFDCPGWMKMLVRDADDPFFVRTSTKGSKPVNGLGNVIDLANIYSCAFIATDDVVKLHPDNKFEILGRADNSDIRGCSLMVTAV